MLEQRRWLWPCIEPTSSASRSHRLRKKWNEAGFRPLLCKYRLNWARRTIWGWWDKWDDTALFEIQTLEVWGQARYLSVTEAPHNTEFYEWIKKKHFCFFQTTETGKRTSNSSVKGNGAKHYPMPPPHRPRSYCPTAPAFSYKLRYIVGIGLV